MPANSNIILSTGMTDLHFAGGAHRRALVVLRSDSARQMRLAVDPRTGSVRLTLPRRARLDHGLLWAETKRSWIETQLARLPGVKPIINGMTLDVAGEALTLDWSPTLPRRVRREGGRLLIGGPSEQMNGRLLRWLRDQARALLTQETLEYAGKIGVTVSAVSVGDPISRWGSCAASGRIRYSWRLILAPDFVRRATVAHEVAHRIHMNHGPAFHALVEELLGVDPAPARKWLRAHGATLHWFGQLS